MARIRIKPIHIVLTFICCLIIFLRLWNSVDWFSFNFDEEYQATLAWSLVKDFHPIWIGVSASNFGFYLGPAFTYLNWFLFWISRGDLSSLAIFSSLFGLVTTVSLYYVVKKIFSKNAAVYAAIFYGGSALLNYFDRRFWNPTPIPFITIWLVYSLYKAEKDTRWYTLTALLMAVSLHVHLSLVVFWPLVVFLILKNIKTISWKTWIFSILSYLVVISPLIVFDFVHNFDNLLSPIRYVLGPKASDNAIQLSTFISHLKPIWHSLGRIWFLSFNGNNQGELALSSRGGYTVPSVFLSLFSLGILAWFVFRQRVEPKFRILFASIILILFAFALYPTGVVEYYLLSFFILFSVVIGLFLQRISTNLTMPIIFIFLLANSITVFTSTQSLYGITTRKHLVEDIMAVVKEDTFSVETYGLDPRKYHPYGGWRYLFKTYGRNPTASFADEFFGWIYLDEISNESIKYRVLISEDIPYTQNDKPKAQFQRGPFYGYIFDY